MSDTRLRITGYNGEAQCWVVQTPEGHIFAECPETVYSEGHERAKQLVDAVNNHERLVEALGKMHAIAEFRESRNHEVIAAGELLAALEAEKGGGV